MAGPLPWTCEVNRSVLFHKRIRAHSAASLPRSLPLTRIFTVRLTPVSRVTGHLHFHSNSEDLQAAVPRSWYEEIGVEKTLQHEERQENDGLKKCASKYVKKSLPAHLAGMNDRVRISHEALRRMTRLPSI